MLSTRLGFVCVVFGLSASALRVPAKAQSSQCIRVPDGMGTGFVNVQPADQPGMQYIVIQNVNIPNRSRGVVSYQLKDFSLTANGKKYHPVTRPGLGAIDISSKTGVLGSGQALKGNLVFLVPDSVRSGNVEFRPSNWFVNGTPLILCCASSCR